MKLDQLLSSLTVVKKTGQDRWKARCPSHEDTTPSLNIRDAGDRVLIHCFTGCSVHNIVAAVGMELSDLFPEVQKTNSPLKQRFMPQDVIQCLSGETLFMVMCSDSLAKGEGLDEVDQKRLRVCHRRFANAAKAAGL